MTSKNLTEAAIERLPRSPTGRRKEVSDMQKGLFLVVYPSGMKSWVVVYRMPDKNGYLTAGAKATIGQWPDVG
jgi:hypothetical protein